MLARPAAHTQPAACPCPRLYGSHEDKDVVWTSGISLVIAAAKADALAQRDLEGRKALGRALRYIAHSHGAHLCYVGGLAAQPGGGRWCWCCCGGTGGTCCWLAWRSSPGLLQLQA